MCRQQHGVSIWVLVKYLLLSHAFFAVVPEDELLTKKALLVSNTHDVGCTHVPIIGTTTDGAQHCSWSCMPVLPPLLFALQAGMQVAPFPAS
jgi:hypothetical protein